MEDWTNLDWKAKSTIQLYLSDLVVLNVSGEDTAKTLCNKLGALYQSKSLVNKMFPQKKLYNLRMKDGNLTTRHMNAFNNVITQVLSINIKISMTISQSVCCVLYQTSGIIWLWLYVVMQLL